MQEPNKPIAPSICSLAGRNIVVTGAAQGIGRAVVDLAIELGATVMAVDMNEGALTELRASHATGRVTTIVGDVSDPDTARRAVHEAVALSGAIHGLVNNAGITRTAMIDKMSLEAWRTVMDVHVSGSFHFLQAVGIHMIERARAGDRQPGAIVNISSDAGRRGTIGQINYGTAKSAIYGMTMSAAREWARYGIRVNTVAFGVVETSMTETIRGDKFRDGYLAQIPLGRFATASEAAKPVCFFLSEGASYVTGQHLSVNGGFTIGF